MRKLIIIVFLLFTNEIIADHAALYYWTNNTALGVKGFSIPEEAARDIRFLYPNYAHDNWVWTCTSVYGPLTYQCIGWRETLYGPFVYAISAWCDDGSGGYMTYAHDVKGMATCADTCTTEQQWDYEINQCVDIPSPKENKNTGAPPCSTSPDVSQGNPINITIGNKYQRETDYRVGGVFPLSVSRSYNSVTASWRFFPEIRMISMGVRVNLIRADGKGLPFRNEGGAWVTDPDVVGTLTASEDSHGTITGWTYKTPNDRTETYDAQGRLLSVTDRTGLSHTYLHQTGRIEVTHSNGATLTYQQDDEGRIIGFTDPNNSAYRYSYSAEGRLIGLTFPDDTPDDATDDPQRIYHYENSTFPRALTGITDENGNRYATWSYDDQGRATSSEHAGGVDRITLDYTYLEDAIDPRATVTSELGKQTTYHLTTVHDVHKVISVEGHPTESCAGANKTYTYDANGFLASKTDWNGNLTTYVYNDRGLETSRTEASGTPEARTITTEWHLDFRLPLKITEPGKITEFTYDDKGRQLTRREINKQ